MISVSAAIPGLYADDRVPQDPITGRWGVSMRETELHAALKRAVFVHCMNTKVGITEDFILVEVHHVHVGNAMRMTITVADDIVEADKPWRQNLARATTIALQKFAPPEGSDDVAIQFIQSIDDHFFFGKSMGEEKPPVKRTRAA